MIIKDNNNPIPAEKFEKAGYCVAHVRRITHAGNDMIKVGGGEYLSRVQLLAQHLA